MTFMLLTKEDFYLFTSVHDSAFSKINISSGFAAADLISFKSERVLAKLHIKMKTSTSLFSSSSSQSFYLEKTSVNLYQLNQQRKQIQELQSQSLSSMIAEQMLEKVMKSMKKAMQDYILS